MKPSSSRLCAVAACSLGWIAFADVAQAQDAQRVTGLAVLAGPGAQSDAWSLARSVYADAALRPAMDEAHARVLAGEDPPADAAPDLRDLAETRAAVHGDDPASKRLLASVATQLHVRGILFVEVGPPPAAPHARVFVAASSSFDPATYAASPTNGATTVNATNNATNSATNNASDGGAAGASNVSWADTVRFLAQSYGPASAAAPGSTPILTGSVTANAAVLAPVPAATTPPGGEPTHHPFYASPWFWGAIGAAAFGGVALYFATRDSDSSTVHLQLQVPR